MRFIIALLGLVCAVALTNGDCDVNQTACSAADGGGCCDDPFVFCCHDGIYCAVNEAACPSHKERFQRLLTTKKQTRCTSSQTACSSADGGGCCDDPFVFCCHDGIYCAVNEAACPTRKAAVTRQEKKTQCTSSQTACSSADGGGCCDDPFVFCCHDGVYCAINEAACPNGKQRLQRLFATKQETKCTGSQTACSSADGGGCCDDPFVFCCHDGIYCAVNEAACPSQKERIHRLLTNKKQTRCTSSQTTCSSADGGGCCDDPFVFCCHDGVYCAVNEAACPNGRQRFQNLFYKRA